MQDIHDDDEVVGQKLVGAHMAPLDADGMALGMGALRALVGQIGLEVNLGTVQGVALGRRKDEIPLFRSVVARPGHHLVRAHDDQDLNVRRDGRSLVMPRVLVGLSYRQQDSLPFSWSR